MINLGLDTRHKKFTDKKGATEFPFKQNRF